MNSERSAELEEPGSYLLPPHLPPAHTCGKPWALELKKGHPHVDGGPLTLLQITLLVDHVHDLAHPGGTWKGKCEVNGAEGFCCPKVGTAAQERGGWPSSPTGFGVGADEQVIRLGLEVLQWPHHLCKVLDKRDPLHIFQWWAGDVLDQLHAVSSQARVGPTFLNNITTMPSVGFLF